MSKDRTKSLLAASLCAAIVLASGCASKGIPLTASAKKSTAKELDMQYSMARAHEQEGKLAEAHQLYESIYQANPDSSEVCHRLGVVKVRIGKTTEGITYLMEADALSPNDAKIKSDLGYAHILQGEFDIAEGFLRDSLNLNPTDMRSVNNLALSVGHQGRMEESFTIYRSVMSDAEAHANIGFVYSEQGNAEMAMRHYDIALDKDPSLKSAAEALVQMNEIQTQVIASQKKMNESGIQLTNGEM
ncbi:tetratricopeptide repeat protein [Thalassoglobus polymorphus]|uniref:Photosystem I assembly protein Ycf3 n=1 Tax=Thalassoglobus polymorphus TaxID=2527994 RepID=A0A517QPW3_9PLAN|nr:tetratricopeptide repeat protein [Thalassoglobus polymorphus]QDT33652.1 photosystem I assembly protein Ycf3 [Thalassoglobus polymorphus]